MIYRLEVSPKAEDGRGLAVIEEARTYLGIDLAAVRTRDVYHLDAELSEAEAQAVLDAITHPVIQSGVIGCTPVTCDYVLIVGFKPGVTDNVSRTLRAAIHDVIGRKLSDDEHAYSSVEYLVTAPGISADQVRSVAEELLANKLIQSISVLDAATVAASGIPQNTPVFGHEVEARVETFDLLSLDDEGLTKLERERQLVLTLDEMRAIRDYLAADGTSAARQAAGLGPEATDAELQALAQTWSEHCKHKIFAAQIDYTDSTTGEQQTIVSLYKSFIQKSTKEIGQRVDWLRSVFTDNAGVIAFNDEVDLVYKVETHNSPSALDPYGGAMTGIVGVNRDPMGTGKGANLLVNVWGYCFADPRTPAEDVPADTLHPRRIREGVHRGVIEGGNQSGIPYGYGWEYFDPRYMGKPLVFCGTVGTLPKTLHGEAGHQKAIKPGDLIVMAGGRIGADGIGGATMSSEELHAESPTGAVQIGDPITQKKLSDFIYEARDAGLYRFITDNGAGGLSSSIGEMATICDGCRMDVAKAPVKYPGLQPWEILLSEAQERMSFAVPPEHIEQFRAMADAREVEIAVLGEFTDSGYFHIEYGDRTIAHLSMEFLHDGCPRLQLPAVWTPPSHDEPADDHHEHDDIGDLICAILSRPNIASDETKARQYDHEVKALSVIKPYIGVANDVVSDATIFTTKPTGKDGIIITAATLPSYSDIDTYHATASAIDLTLRRTLAVGGQLGHVAGLDNFCWPDPVLSAKTPDGPYKLAQLVRANQALYDVCNAYDLPCISGKDSMKNDSSRGGVKISIPPTLLFSTIARMADISKAVTLDAKRVGDLVYILGYTGPHLGGSEYFAHLGYTGNNVPTVDTDAALKLYSALATATDQRLCHSVHTPALGGIAVGLAKIALGGRLGLEIDLAAIPAPDDLLPHERLFSESNSRFIVTISRRNQAAFEALFAGLPHAQIGQVKYDPTLTLYQGDEFLAEVGLDTLLSAYTSPLRD